MTETAQNGWINRTGHYPNNATNPKMLDAGAARNGQPQRKKTAQPTTKEPHLLKTDSKPGKQNRLGWKSGATHKLNGEPNKNRQTENQRHDTTTDNLGTNHPSSHWRKSQLPEAISGDNDARNGKQPAPQNHKSRAAPIRQNNGSRNPQNVDRSDKTNPQRKTGRGNCWPFRSHELTTWTAQARHT